MQNHLLCTFACLLKCNELFFNIYDWCVSRVCIFRKINQFRINKKYSIIKISLPLCLSLSLSASLALTTKVAKSDKGELCGGLASNFPKWVIIWRHLLLQIIEMFQNMTTSKMLHHKLRLRSLVLSHICPTICELRSM